jgi:hypothetical protein
MNLNKLNDWLQLAAALGVIGGLLLVAMELRQEANLTRAEMGSEYFGAFEGVYRSMQNEPTARAIAKSCEAPSEMTFDEHLIIEGFYVEAISSIFGREYYMQQRGIFVDDLQISANWVAEILFSCQYGIDWYQVNRQTIMPEIVPLLDNVLNGELPRNHLDSVEALEERIRRRLKK